MSTYFQVDTSEMGLRELGGGPKLSCHAPGQQFFNPAEGVIRDAAQHFTQPAFWIGAVKACRSQQGVDGSGTLTAAV